MSIKNLGSSAALLMWPRGLFSCRRSGKWSGISPIGDPVRMVPRYASELRALRAIWIDAGTRDEWFLDLGAEAFRAALREIGVAEDVIRFELFDGTHMGIDYRYPLALAWLCQRIA